MHPDIVFCCHRASSFTQRGKLSRIHSVWYICFVSVCFACVCSMLYTSVDRKCEPALSSSGECEMFAYTTHQNRTTESYLHLWYFAHDILAGAWRAFAVHAQYVCAQQHRIVCTSVSAGAKHARDSRWHSYGAAVQMWSTHDGSRVRSMFSVGQEITYAVHKPRVGNARCARRCTSENCTWGIAHLRDVARASDSIECESVSNSLIIQLERNTRQKYTNDFPDKGKYAKETRSTEKCLFF